MVKLLLFFFLMGPITLWGAEEVDEVPTLRARLIHFLDRTHFQARIIEGKQWTAGVRYAVFSDDGETLAFVSLQEVIDCKNRREGQPACLLSNSSKELVFEVDRILDNGFVLTGDQIRVLDLAQYPEFYQGHTDLLIDDKQKVSSRYKPLVSQGYSIGPTAAHLSEGEQVMSFLGYYSYGISNKWSVSTLIPANLFGAPNLSTKFSLLQVEGHILSGGLSVAEKQADNRYTFSFSLYWDSISGDNQISHTALNIALGSWDLNAESENLTLMGSSTIQTGYEFLLNNWDRLIVGPKYNFERDAVGGHIGYMWVWDYYHLLLTLNSADIASFEYSAQNGYFVTLDMYWRF